MNLLQAAFSQEILTQCIDKGIDKTIPVSVLRKFCVADYRTNLIAKIESGGYQLSPPRVVKIPKDNGSFREIYVCKPVDRVVLTLINSALNYLYEDKLSPACKSYQQGLSCATAVREVPKPILAGYKVDLSKYFDSVSKDTLMTMLKELDTGSAADRLLRDFYSDDRVIIGKTPVERYKSLGQGCATAAFLSNYLLRHVDAKMMQQCSYYCRYSDDMLLLGPNAESALAVLKQELLPFGLALNPSKVEQVSPDKEFKFLGFGINGPHITISKKDLQAKKREVKHALKMIDYHLSHEERLKKSISAVKRIFFNYAEPCHGWLYMKALGINDYSRISELDEYCKDCIRASILGRWNYTHNIHQIPNSLLEENGYVSLVHMAKVAHISRALFMEEHLLCVVQHMK